MLLSIILIVIVAVCIYFAKLQGKKHWVKAGVNLLLAIGCLAWSAYRFYSGLHPISIGLDMEAVKFVSLSEWGMLQYTTAFLAIFGGIGILKAYNDMANG